jgi:hypothetical protein
MTKKVIYSAIIVFTIEFLFLDVDGLSWKTSRWEREVSKYAIGFPFRSLTLTTQKVTGHIYSWENYPEHGKWIPGLKIEPLLIVDVIVLGLLFYVFGFLIPLNILKFAVISVAMGFLVTLTMLLTGGYSSEFPFWFTITLVFLFLPLSIYALSLTTKSQKTCIIGIVISTMLVTVAAEYVLYNIFISCSYEFDPVGIIYMLTFIAILLTECFGIMLIHKKILPLIYKSN